jgi:hypothetical protein
MSEIDGGENHAEQDAAVVAAATHIEVASEMVSRAEHTDEIWGNLTLQTRHV